MMNSPGQLSPLIVHWHYFDRKSNLYVPFSAFDSKKLEDIYLSGERDVIVHVEGGRYDVAVDERIMQPVYWTEDDIPVIR
eukprot:Pgem_evm1s10950